VVYRRDSFGQCGHGDRTEKVAPTLLTAFGRRRVLQALRARTQRVRALV
jgi:hypothetical protein